MQERRMLLSRSTSPIWSLSPIKINRIHSRNTPTQPSSGVKPRFASQQRHHNKDAKTRHQESDYLKELFRKVTDDLKSDSSVQGSLGALREDRKIHFASQCLNNANAFLNFVDQSTCGRVSAIGRRMTHRLRRCSILQTSKGIEETVTPSLKLSMGRTNRIISSPERWIQRRNERKGMSALNRLRDQVSSISGSELSKETALVPLSLSLWGSMLMKYRLWKIRNQFRFFEFPPIFDLFDPPLKRSSTRMLYQQYPDLRLSDLLISVEHHALPQLLRLWERNLLRECPDEISKNAARIIERLGYLTPERAPTFGEFKSIEKAAKRHLLGFGRVAMKGTRYDEHSDSVVVVCQSEVVTLVIHPPLVSSSSYPSSQMILKKALQRSLLELSVTPNAKTGGLIIQGANILGVL